ncbi:MAG: hypothetical protein ISS36_01880 [Candidatus Aenigmarchaeota archaeon]|nr:hypothetical protein [Candidatus Aenigmarchaeota archaeon]
MSFKILIQTPAAILIVAGVLFLAFNDNTTGWILVILGFILSAFIVFLSTKAPNDQQDNVKTQ